LEKHFRQVSPAQLVAEAPQDDQAGHVRRLLQPIEWGPRTFIKDPFAVATTEAAVA
jgi:hypothetical protein